MIKLHQITFPMSPWKRFLLFSFFVGLFFVVGGSAFFYSQGWRINLKTLTVTKVGAIFVRTVPRNTTLSLDGRMIKNTSWLFQNGTLINNLFPKEYHLKISLAGYRNVERTFTVAPSRVADAKYITLIPTEPTPLPNATSGVSRVWSVASAASPLVSSGNTLRRGKQKISGSEITGLSDDGERALTVDAETGVRYFFDGKTGSSTPLATLFKKSGLNDSAHFALNTAGNSEIVALDADSLVRFDLAERKLIPVKMVSGSVMPYLGASLSASRALIALSRFDAKANVSHLGVFDEFLNRFTTQDVLIPGKTVRTQIIKNNGIVVLQDDGELYLYSLSSTILKKLASDAKAFAVSENGNRFGVLGRHSLEVISLEEKTDYRRFRLPEHEGKTDIAWYKDDQHFFIYSRRGVSFLDVDDTKLEDFQLLTEDPNAVYEKASNALYFANNGALLELSLPE